MVFKGFGRRLFGFFGSVFVRVVGNVFKGFCNVFLEFCTHVKENKACQERYFYGFAKLTVTFF